MDLIEQLIGDHRHIEFTLHELKRSQPGNSRECCIRDLNASFESHMVVAERFVYPLADRYQCAGATELSEREHRSVRRATARLGERAAEPSFQDALRVLELAFVQHVKEEEIEIFPLLQSVARSEIDAMGDPGAVDHPIPLPRDLSRRTRPSFLPRTDRRVDP